MKYLISFLIVFHGIIHILGFLKAFKLAEVEQLNSEISRFSGILWLITSILFVVSGIMFLIRADSWYILGILAVLISTILIITTWQDSKFGSIPNIIILILAIIAFGTQSYYNNYKSEVKKSLELNKPIPAAILTEEDISDLPDAVKKYIRISGSIGKPQVSNFRIEFTGNIRKNEQSDWMPFTTEQYNFMEPATRLFFMKAVMKHLPVAGFHSFKNGEASMDIRLLSLFRVQYLSGKEMGISETVTFFNDMCCMAPATLIDKRIEWIESDSSRVKAAFTNNGIRITAELLFNENGDLVNFISEDRYAAGDNKKMERLPWLTPLKEVKDVDGFRLATSAELIYKYPEGDLCYGTFNLVHVEYNCTE